MQDLRQALSEISAIRGQVARGVLFQGYGPTTLAVTGALALLAGLVQAAFLPEVAANPRPWLGLWIATAVVSMALVAWEAVTRARRLHSDLADDLIREAAIRFAPAAIAGGALPFVLLHAAPEALWMLPGLWQILFALGSFSGAAGLPRPMAWVGAWYLATGLLVLALAPGEGGFAPWVMAAPFALGQSLAAILLTRATAGGEGSDV